MTEAIGEVGERLPHVDIQNPLDTFVRNAKRLKTIEGDAELRTLGINGKLHVLFLASLWSYRRS